MGESRDLVEQRRQHRSVGGGWGDSSIAQTLLPDVCGNRLQGRDEVGQEACRVAVVVVKGKPCRTNRRFRTVAAGGPLADHGGLAEASCGGHKRQSALQALVESFDQAGARDRVGPRRRDVELGGENRRRHQPIVGRDPKKPGSDRVAGEP